MKTNASQILFVLVAFASWYPSMGQPFDTDGTRSRIRDFTERLSAAIEKRDPMAIRALYQTNGVAESELNAELGHWQPLLDARARVHCDQLYFKDLSRAWAEWRKQAHAVTTHECTHLVFVPWRVGDASGRAMLRLVLVQDRWLIVPSDKTKRLPGGSEPNGAADGSQPSSTDTNRASGAVGPRR